jgi:hypothetical protein
MNGYRPAIFAGVAGLVEKLVQGIGHQNLLGTEYMASLVIILSCLPLIHKSDRIAIATISH